MSRTRMMLGAMIYMVCICILIIALGILSIGAFLINFDISVAVVAMTLIFLSLIGILLSNKQYRVWKEYAKQKQERQDEQARKDAEKILKEEQEE